MTERVLRSMAARGLLSQVPPLRQSTTTHARTFAGRRWRAMLAGAAMAALAAWPAGPLAAAVRKAAPHANPVLPGIGAMGPAGGSTSYPFTFRDDTGTSITMTHRPLRIVSLTLGTDEILAGLVRRSRLAGVTSLASNPADSFVVQAVRGIPALPAANAEQVVAARPDLVFAADYTRPGVIAQLRHAGITVVEFGTFDTLSDVERHIALIGRIVDDEARAHRMIAAMKAEVARVGRAVRGLPRPTVLYFASDDYIAGGATTPDFLIRAAGGSNAAAAAHVKGWPQVGYGEIVRLHPDVLLTDLTGRGDLSRGGGFAARLLAEPSLSAVPAVTHHMVWGLSARALSDVSEYMAWDAQDVAHILHPLRVAAFAP